MFFCISPISFHKKHIPAPLIYIQVFMSSAFPPDNDIPAAAHGPHRVLLLLLFDKSPQFPTTMIGFPRLGSSARSGFSTAPPYPRVGARVGRLVRCPPCPSRGLCIKTLEDFFLKYGSFCLLICVAKCSNSYFFSPVELLNFPLQVLLVPPSRWGRSQLLLLRHDPHQSSRLYNCCHVKHRFPSKSIYTVLYAIVYIQVI